jgi:hypothetical protein
LHSLFHWSLLSKKLKVCNTRSSITRMQQKLRKKNEKYHTVRTVPKLNGKFVETETKLIPLTCIYDQFFSWLGTETSIYKKGDGVILSLWAYTSLFVKWCGHARVFHMWVWYMWTTFLDISVRFMVLNATFNNSSAISWWSVLFMEDTGVPEENYRPAASHWQTLSQVI